MGDAKAHRYVQVGRHGGWTRLNGTSLLVAFGSPRKAIHPRLRIAFVPLGKLPPVPACA